MKGLKPNDSIELIVEMLNFTLFVTFTTFLTYLDPIHSAQDLPLEGVPVLQVHWEWGVGSGEWGVGSGEWGVGSGEWGVGSGEWAVQTSLGAR
jgi:hypothetical protein